MPNYENHPLLTFLSLCAISGFAASGRSVSYRSGDETVHGMLYTPEAKGPFPALVVNETPSRARCTDAPPGMGGPITVPSAR